MQIAAQRTVDHLENPLDGFQFSRLAQAVDGLNREQLNWASGYLAGLGARPGHVQAVDQAPAMTILYASQGGNARAVAESLERDASARGLMPRLVPVDQYKPRDLSRERLLIVVISTQGEGEPPENARELFRYLNGRKQPKLDGLRYAVFGLGDSSYALFCQAGKDLDDRLRALGAAAFAPRVDADVDYETQTGSWSGEVLALVEKALPGDQARVIPLQPEVSHPVRFDRHHPYQAEVLDNRRITTEDAVSAVLHLALQIDPNALHYQPGDSLGVLFRNDPALVEEILDLTGLAGDASVTLQGESLSLSEALSSRLELTQLHPTVVTGWADISGSSYLAALRGQGEQLRLFAHRRQFVELLRAHPASLEAGDLVSLLRPVQTRLYSIASSQKASADEVHLTVSRLQYQALGRDHLGGASGYLTQRVFEGDSQAVYVAENAGFRLPKDTGTPVIMVGAGTGVAPYRGFLQEREAEGSNGRNWLVFGSRHFHRDFLYQTDWLNYRRAGLLERVSLAFSRDAQDRIYVQDRLREEGAELYRWLQDGAHLYVCGGLAMEKAVRQSVQAVARQHGGLGDEAAAQFFDDLLAQGRYLKDVY